MRLLPALFALALPVPASAHPLEDFDANVRRGLQPVPGSIAVRAAVGVEAAELDGLAAEVGCWHDHRWGTSDWHSLTCPTDLPPRELVRHFAGLDAVSWAQAPFPAELTATPDDLGLRQWHLDNTGQSIGGRRGTVGADISAVSAWDVTTGTGGLVAVLDTGVLVDHAGLTGRIHQSAGELCGNGKDDDSNGYIDDCVGWDTGDGDADPDPTALPSGCQPGHGTFIAGLVAEAGNNGAGGTGLLWDGRVLPVKIVRDSDCGLTDVSVAEAVYYAVDAGAHAINASWKVDGVSEAMRTAFAKAAQNDVVIAISAGNDTKDVDTLETWPIDLHVPTDIVVMATTNTDTRADFSNWGSEDVDLAAPGWRLYSLGIDSTTQWVEGSGTSYAAPLVAGVAALVRSEYPMLRGEEVKASILDGATPVTALDCASGPRCVATGARLDAAGALDEAAWWATTPRVSLVGLDVVDTEGGDGDLKLERGERATLRIQLENIGHVDAADVVASVRIAHPHVAVTTSTLAVGRIEAYRTARPTAGFGVEVPLACVVDEAATLTLDVEDRASGERWTATRTLSVRCDIDDDDDGVRYPEDCDDGDPTVSPDADERCNEIDDDCDGDVDEDDAVDAVPWYPDDDGDGYGRTGTPAKACKPPEGYGGGVLDCDDNRADVHPGATEVCDGADNDCNALTDDEAVDASTWYIDEDGDGWGSDRAIQSCEQLRGTVDRDGDCDDEDADAWPGSDSHRTDCTLRPRFLGMTCSSTGAVGGLPLALLGLLAIARRRAGSRPSRASGPRD